MVKKQSPKVKRAGRKKARSRAIPLPLLWLVVPVAAGLLCWWTGLDGQIAKLVYQPDSKLAWLLRQYGTWPSAVLALVSLGALLVPGLGDKRPRLYHAALITVLTTLLGAGLLSQVLVQEVVERQRPRESVLLQTTPQTELRGQSFPSGHAAMGVVLAAPAFAFAVGSRRRRAILAVGLTSVAVVGGARMVLGAHFLGDILAAVGFTLGTAALLAPVTARVRHVQLWLVAFIMALAVLAIILGNKFTLDLTLPEGTRWQRLNLPCSSTTAKPVAGVTAPQLHVHLKGFGAPLSNLRLRVDEYGTVTLGTRQGLYHSLSCTATIALPME